MDGNTTVPKVSPDRTDVMPDLYVLYVDDQHVPVWEYRHTLAERDGEWYLHMATGPTVS
jgi:hypothetical protein